jgi:hypothetical protein
MVLLLCCVLLDQLEQFSERTLLVPPFIHAAPLAAILLRDLSHFLRTSKTKPAGHRSNQAVLLQLPATTPL